MKLIMAKSKRIIIYFVIALIIFSSSLGYILYQLGYFKSGADITGELVYSADFEAETVGKSPSQYELWWYLKSLPEQLQIVNDGVDGSKAMRLESRWPDHKQVLVYPKSALPTLSGGQWYEASFDARASRNEYPFRFYITPFINDTEMWRQASTDWQNFKLVFYVYSNTSNLKHAFEMNRPEVQAGATGGFLWIDNFKVKKIAQTNYRGTVPDHVNLLPNSDFSLGIEKSVNKGTLSLGTRTEALPGEKNFSPNPCAVWEAGFQYISSAKDEGAFNEVLIKDYPATYTFSGYIKGSGIDLYVQDASRQVLANKYIEAKADSWQRFSIEVPITKFNGDSGSGGIGLNNKVYLFGYTYKTIGFYDTYLDNLQFEKGTLSDYQPSYLRSTYLENDVNINQDTTLTTNKYANTFYLGEGLDFNVNLANYDTATSFNGSYELNFSDYLGNNVLTKSESINLAPSEVKRIPLKLDVPLDQRNLYNGEVILKDSSGKQISSHKASIAKIEPFDQADFQDPDPYFGNHISGLILSNSSSVSKIEAERWRLAKDLGITENRGNGNIIHNVSETPTVSGPREDLKKLTSRGYHNLEAFNFSQFNSKTVQDPAKYKAWAKQYAINNKSHALYWETQNEPWIADDAMKIDDFIKVQKAIIAGVKEGDPNVKIVSNAPYSYRDAWLDSNPKPRLPKEALDGADAASIHYYTDNTRETLEGSIPAMIKRFRETVLPVEYKDMPIWQTEGSSRGLESLEELNRAGLDYGVTRLVTNGFSPTYNQAAYREVKSEILLKAAGVEKNYIFHFGNTIYAPPFFDHWSQPRPIYLAVAALTRALDNTELYRAYHDQNDQLHLFIFKKKNADKYMMTFWLKYSEPNYIFKLNQKLGSLTSIDFMGNEFTPTTSGNTSSYNVTSFPQYINFTGDIKQLTDALNKNLAADPDFNRKPTISSINPSASSPEVNQQISFSATTSDLDSDDLAYSWNFGDGDVSTQESPVHAYTSTGDYKVFLTISDGYETASKTQTITVTSPIVIPPENNPPVLNAVGDQTVEVDQNLNFKVKATDQDNDDLTYTATNLPKEAAFDSEKQKFNWTPTSNDVGAYSNITFSVSDGTDTDSESISITVSSATVVPPANNPPILDPIGSQSVEAGSNLQFKISATDEDKDKLTYSATNLPSGSSFNANNQKFNWTPTSNDVGAYSNITFSVSDGTDTSSETMTITVSAASVGGGDEEVSPPTNLQIFDNSNNIHLSWDDDKNIRGTVGRYNIYRRINQGTVENIDTSKSTNYIDKTAPDNSYLQYAVQTVSKLGTTSSLSAAVDIILPDLTPPTAPTNLTATIEDNNTLKPKLTLTWNASTDNTTAQDKIKYWLYRAVDGADLKEINNAYKTTIDDTSVKNQSGVYSYYVLAQDKNKLYSAPSNTVNIQVTVDQNNKGLTPVTSLPEPPQNLKLNLRYSRDSQAYHVDVLWEHSKTNNLKKYLIYRNNVEVDNTTANKTSLLDANPPVGISTYTIKSINDQDVVSDPSNAVTVNVPDGLKINKLQMNEITTNQAKIFVGTNIPSEVKIKYGKLSWLKSYQYLWGKINTAYTPQINLDETASDDTIIEGHTTTLSSLSRNSLYYYQIEVQNPANSQESITVPQQQFRTPMFGWWR